MLFPQHQGANVAVTVGSMGFLSGRPDEAAVPARPVPGSSLSGLAWAGLG